MFGEILRQAWAALARNRTRSFLTMLGMVWGVACATILIAYGTAQREVLVGTFEAAGKSLVICFGGQTSEQAGGERAGRRIRLSLDDLERVRAQATLVRQSSLETISRVPVTYGDRVENAIVRGVYPEYGEMRNEQPEEGRWISQEDFQERRRVVFLGWRLRQKLFSGRPAVGEFVRIQGVRYGVIGVMYHKVQLWDYYDKDEHAAFIPYPAAGELWDAKYATDLVAAPADARGEAKAAAQLRAVIAARQRFSATDKRALQTFGTEDARPVVDGISVGMQALLLVIGLMTLGIGGVGLMNIMLVSVDERTREIGLLRALGARRRHIRTQILAETLTLALIGGAFGTLVAYGIAAVVGTIPFLGPLMEDVTGSSDIHLQVSPLTIAVSTCFLLLVAVLSGWAPAERASNLAPAEALRYE